MNLRSYLASQNRGEASKLAARLGISISYLSQMSTGKSAISASRCVEIERETNGLVTRQELRPDDWHLIWPELATDSLSETSAHG